MARTKKATPKMAAPPKEETYTLTKQQFESLKTAAELISEARRELHDFEPENLATAGFIAGQAFVSINKAEDLVDELVNTFINDDWDDENF